MDDDEDSTDEHGNDPALAAWYARRVRLRNMADLACVTYGLHDSDHLRDRIEVAIQQIRDVQDGHVMTVAGEVVVGFTTPGDEAAIGKLKKAAHRFQGLLDDHAVLDFMPETQALRASLRTYREFLDTIEHRRPKGSGQQRDPGHLLVHQLASRWPEIAGRRATAWPDKTPLEDNPPSRFSLVVRGICEMLKNHELPEMEIPANGTIAGWLRKGRQENRL